MICRHPYHCNLVVKNDLNEIDSIWEAIAKALEKYGLDRRDLFQINLVVDELFTNIVSYAFPDKQPHDIEANICVDKKNLVVEFVDDGKAFNPVAYKEPGRDIVFGHGRVDGEISLEPMEGPHGFGFDPVFIPYVESGELSDLSFSQMELDVKNRYSHRSRAVTDLINKLSGE